MSWFNKIVDKFSHYFNTILLTPEEKLKIICEEGGIEELIELTEEYPSLFKQDQIYFIGTNREGFTPLILAIKNRHLWLVDYLVSQLSVSIMEKEKKWHGTPLHHACRSNNVAIIEYLIDKKADVNAKTDDKATPLHW